MSIQEFCDIYAVANRDRIAAQKYFAARGVVDTTEDDWTAKFDAARFNLGRAGKPLLKNLLVKSLEQLVEMAQVHPAEEWSDFATKKAKLAHYLSNK